MKIYLAILKPNVKVKDIKKELSKVNIEIADFYPKLSILKLKSRKEINVNSYLKYFETIEEEKTDFNDEN